MWIPNGANEAVSDVYFQYSWYLTVPTNLYCHKWNIVPFLWSMSPTNKIYDQANLHVFPLFNVAYIRFLKNILFKIHLRLFQYSEYKINSLNQSKHGQMRWFVDLAGRIGHEISSEFGPLGQNSNDSRMERKGCRVRQDG